MRSFFKTSALLIVFISCGILSCKKSKNTLPGNANTRLIDGWKVWRHSLYQQRGSNQTGVGYPDVSMQIKYIDDARISGIDDEVLTYSVASSSDSVLVFTAYRDGDSSRLDAVYFSYARNAITYYRNTHFSNGDMDIEGYFYP